MKTDCTYSTTKDPKNGIGMVPLFTTYLQLTLEPKM